jgi:hypothetical protein
VINVVYLKTSLRRSFFMFKRDLQSMNDKI